MSGAKKPVLAVDFDEVCVGYVASFIEFNNATYKTDLKVEDFDTYCFWLVPKCQLAVKEDATDRVYEFHATPFFDTVAPIPGTHEALKALAERCAAARPASPIGAPLTVQLLAPAVGTSCTW